MSILFVTNTVKFVAALATIFAIGGGQIYFAMKELKKMDK